MMRILYLLPELPPSFGGGIATVYGHLLPLLVEEGLHVTVLLSSREHLDAPQYKWQGVDVIPLQSWALSQAEAELNGWRHNAFIHQFLPLAWGAWIQAQELGPFDLIEATDWAFLFIPWLVQKRSQPVIVSLHGSCGQVDWHGNPRARGGEGQLVRLLEAAVLPLADAVIANSNLNAEFWWQQCGVRAQVIPPISKNPAAPPVGDVRLQRGVVAGRLQNWKGPEVLCEALRLVPNQQVDWIGQDTPWQESPLSSSAHLRQAFPDVLDHQLHWLGKLPADQVHARISAAVFLCVPSLWDVFNVTVLEAIAAGTPVLCSRQAGASMFVEHGRTGYLFDPHQPEQLADAIRSVQAITEIERKRLTAQAMAHAEGLTDAKLFARKHKAQYTKTIVEFRGRDGSPWLCEALLNRITLANLNTFVRQRRSVSTELRRILRWLPLIHRR